MLGEVIGMIVDATSPEYVELALFGTILKSVVAHVDGFRSSLLDGTIDDAFGGGIVGLHWRGWLLVPELGEHGSDGDGVDAVDE